MDGAVHMVRGGLCTGVVVAAPRALELGPGVGEVDVRVLGGEVAPVRDFVFPGELPNLWQPATVTN